MKTQCKMTEKNKPATKVVDSTTAKIIKLKDCDSPLLEIKVVSKENNHKTESSVLVVVNNVTELDNFIEELKALRPKLPGSKLVCQFCNISDGTVKTHTDPYAQEVRNQEEEIDACPTCLRERARDV